MGIYNGPSIYNQGGGGGGGGGYHDGGQIVDGDFMKVENNAVSSYDNTSRDPVNFYFEVADGEMINSVIELTTAVNATINVYVLKDGFYYILGNVGGNTVNAGDNYKINITGDSFSIEQVSNVNNNMYTNIDGKLVKCVKINNQYWTDYVSYDTENPSLYLDKVAFGETIRYYKFSGIKNFGEWRVPTLEDTNKLISYVGVNVDKIKSTSNWHNDWNGNDEWGFNARPIASLDSSGNLSNDDLGYYQTIWVNKVEDSLQFQLNLTYNNQFRVLQQLPNRNWCAIRLVKDV